MGREMLEAYFKRSNMIDGVPSSFEVTYVTKTGKKCQLCNRRIGAKEIAKNEIIYTDEFEFSHKSCLSENGVFYEHLRPDDPSSPTKLKLNRKAKSESAKKKSEQAKKESDETKKP